MTNLWDVIILFIRHTLIIRDVYICDISRAVCQTLDRFRAENGNKANLVEFVVRGGGGRSCFHLSSENLPHLLHSLQFLFGCILAKVT